MTDKTCTGCHKAKDREKDFYISQGRVRSQCKECIIKKNVQYQIDTQAWLMRDSDDEQRRAYMVEYYAKNKEKFAEYRRKFKNSHPEYYKVYARDRKDKKNARRPIIPPSIQLLKKELPT